MSLDLRPAAERASALLAAAEQAFATPGLTALWERQRSSTSMHDPGAARTLDAIRDRVAGPANLIAIDGQETIGFAFASGADIATVLLECPGFVFYVVDDEVSYLLSFNDHDVLAVSGTLERAG